MTAISRYLASVVPLNPTHARATVAITSIAVIARKSQHYAVTTNVLTNAVAEGVALTAITGMGEVVKKEMTHACAEETFYLACHQLGGDTARVCSAVVADQAALRTNTEALVIEDEVAFASDAERLHHAELVGQLHYFCTGRDSGTASSDHAAHITAGAHIRPTTFPTILHHIPT